MNSVQNDGINLEAMMGIKPLNANTVTIVEDAPTQPSYQLQLQVVNVLQQNQEKVKALHRYVAHILEKTPRTIEEFRICYKEIKNETEVFELFTTMQQHCRFFNDTLEPKLMKVSAELESYTISVKENYETIISEISEKNLKEQMSAIPEVTRILLQDLIANATTHFNNAKEVEEMLITCHDDTISDLNALGGKLLDLERDSNQSQRIVDSIRAQLGELEVLQDQVNKEYEYYNGTTNYLVKIASGWCAYQIMLAKKNLNKPPVIDKKDIPILNKKIDEILPRQNEVSIGIIERAKQYILEMSPQQKREHIMNIAFLTYGTYNSVRLTLARKKRNQLLEKIQLQGKELRGEEAILGNLLILKADLIEISGLLKESCLGIEFLRSSWSSIVLDLNSVIEKTTQAKDRDKLIQLRIDLEVAKQLWSKLQKDVSIFRDTAFIMDKK